MVPRSAPNYLLHHDHLQRDTSLVFRSSSGILIDLIDQRDRTHRSARLAKQTGVKRIAFHGMWHTHATLLLLAGVNVKAVSARLGQGSIQITLDTHAHLLPQMEEQAAEAIEQFLARDARARAFAPYSALLDNAKGPHTRAFFSGEPPETRTRNPLIKSQLLCQLS